MGFTWAVPVKKLNLYLPGSGILEKILKILPRTLRLIMLIYYSSLCRGIHRTGNRHLGWLYFSLYYLKGNTIDKLNRHHSLNKLY